MWLRKAHNHKCLFCQISSPLSLSPSLLSPQQSPQLQYLSLSLSSTASMATTATATKLPSTSSSAFFFSYSTRLIHHHPTHLIPFKQQQAGLSCPRTAAVRRIIACKATEVEEGETTAAAAAVSTVDDGKNWVPVVPLAALPKGERRVIIQDGETILLLWYKDEVIAIENRSPAEGAYSEGLLNAKLTQDGCIVCPTTDSTYDLRTGAVKDWYPNNPILRVLTPSLRSLFLYPVKTDDDNIYISMSQGFGSGVSAEIVFSGRAQPGVTASDVNVEEVRMVVDEDSVGFGFTAKNELINGKAAIIGFLLLIDFEALTGKGLLKGTGFLDFIYAASNAINSL